MKKFIALLCATTLLAAMPVLAAPSPDAGSVSGNSAPVAAPAAQASASTAVVAGFAKSLDAQFAAARGMSAVEYYNNTVVSTPGVENAMPVGQGGKIVVNGVATNLTATLSKVTSAVATDAKAQAATLGGTLLNVLKVDFPGANYNVATINFYLKGLEAGTNVVVKQFVDGAWINVEIVEVRADHVVLNLTNSGAVAFVVLP